MTTSERWLWHTDTYAWRIVHGYGSFDDIRIGKYSPTDPRGEWWDEGAVRLKVKLMTADRDRRAYAAEDAQRDLAAKGRDLREAWARKHGFLDWAAAERAGVKTTDITKAAAAAAAPPRGPRLTHYAPSDFGVKAAPVPIVIPEGQGAFLQAELAKRLGKATGEAAE